jgi:hypothetical protein
MAHNRRVLGAYEQVDFPDYKISDVMAKIDTGAYTGALHATNMMEATKRNGSKELIFHPLGKADLEVRTDHYSKKRVRSSNGQMEERYMLETNIKIDGEIYPILITLTDRSSMRKSLLIGRKFLRTHNFLVDVRKRATYRNP